MKKFKDLKVGDVVYRVCYIHHKYVNGNDRGWIDNVTKHKIARIEEIKIGKLFVCEDNFGFTIVTKDLEDSVQKIICNDDICCDTEMLLRMLTKDKNDFEVHHINIKDKLKI